MGDAWENHARQRIRSALNFISHEIKPSLDDGNPTRNIQIFLLYIYQ